MTFNHMDTGSVPVGRTNKEIKFSNAPEAHVDGPSAFNGKVEGSRPSRCTKCSIQIEQNAFVAQRKSFRLLNGKSRFRNSPGAQNIVI